MQRLNFIISRNPKAGPVLLRRSLRIALIATALIPQSISAQNPLRSKLFDEPRPQLWQLPIAEPRSVPGLVLGGAAAGVVGTIVGFFAGASFGAIFSEVTEADDGAALPHADEMAAGAIWGETLMLPLGVHLANARRGNFASTLLGSVAMTGGGYVLHNRGVDSGALLVIVPIAQLATTVIIERETSR